MMAFLHTYSVVALDKEKNQLGVAVQSHWFAVGTVCPWIAPGVGAVATQSIAEPGYGPKGFNLLKKGKTVQETLGELLKADDSRDLRQVAIVDTFGNVAAHTGSRCIAEAGHETGDCFSVQANMMLSKAVWPAMARAFRNSKGPLADRLMATLYAAQKAGGDIRGKQSASILIADNVKDNTPWKHIVVDLRVDDHPYPLQELDRLIKVQYAYELMNEGDNLLSKDLTEEAGKKYDQASQLAPEIDEIPFWQAVTMADSGNIKEALPIFKKVFNIDPNWAILVQRLPASGLLTKDLEVMRKILSVIE